MAGISRDRLQIEAGIYVDDDTVGSRMLLATCTPSEGTPDPCISGQVAWIPPEAITECSNGHQLITQRAGNTYINKCTACENPLENTSVIMTCGICSDGFCKKC